MILYSAESRGIKTEWDVCLQAHYMLESKCEHPPAGDAYVHFFNFWGDRDNIMIVFAMYDEDFQKCDNVELFNEIFYYGMEENVTHPKFLSFKLKYPIGIAFHGIGKRSLDVIKPEFFVCHRKILMSPADPTICHTIWPFPKESEQSCFYQAIRVLHAFGRFITWTSFSNVPIPDFDFKAYAVDASGNFSEIVRVDLDRNDPFLKEFHSSWLAFLGIKVREN